MGAEGWEQGWLGYPLSDEDGADGVRFNRFEHGYVFWSLGAGAVAVRSENSLRHPASDEYCDISEVLTCPVGGDIFENMVACQYGAMQSTEIVFALGPPSTWPIIYLTCSGYRHIMDDHDAHEDMDRFAMCMALTYERGSYWSGSHTGLGIKWQNSTSGAWGYISYEYSSSAPQYEVVTAFPSGPTGNDWGSCTKGLINK